MGFRTPEQFFADLVSRVEGLERRLLKRNPPGQMITYVGTKTDPPPGTVWAEGALLQIAQYPRLFDEFGSYYGGDGVTTFRVIDMRGRVPVGLDPSQSEFDTLGEAVGEKAHTLTADEMPSHSHGSGANSDGFAAHATGGGGYDAVFAASGSGEAFFYRAPSSAGGGQAHNNLPPERVVRYAIYY